MNDAENRADLTACPVCGRDSCEDHIPSNPRAARDQTGVTFSASDGRYRYSALGGAIEFTVDHLRRERFSLIGELEVQCAIKGAPTYGDHRLLITTLNCSSARAKEEVARLVAKRARTGNDVDWVGLLEDCTQRIWADERRGSPSVALHEVPRPSPDATVQVHGFTLLKKHPQVGFAPGGSMKSLLGLSLVGELGRQKIKTLLLDWEMDGGEQRVRYDALDLPQTIRYRPCDQPLIVLADSIRRDAQDHGTEFLLLDSVAPACSGRVEDAEVAIEFFKAWRRIGLGGLAIAHTRAEDGEQRPFGSVFWHNLARATWFLKRVDDATRPDHITVGVYQRKANFGPLRPPFGLELHLENDPDDRDLLTRVTIRRVDISAVAALASTLPLQQRICGALRHGAKTIADLATELDAVPDTVRKTLNRGKDRAFTLVTTHADGVHRWGLLDRRTP